MTKRDRQRLAYALEGGDPEVTHQPFVWTVKAGDEYAFFWNERTSDLYSFAMNSPALPLYRSPQTTLTDEEREAVAWAARAADKERQYAEDAADRGYRPEGGSDLRAWADGHGARAATLRSLLERLK